MGLNHIRQKTYVSDRLQQLNIGNLYVPVLSPQQAGEVMMKGFGWDSDENRFVNGWEFNVATASHAALLRTFCTGTLSCEQNNGTLKIILQCNDVIAAVRLRDTQPVWLQMPKYIIYQYLDETFTKAMIESYLRENSDIIRQLQLYYYDATTGQQVPESPERVYEKFVLGRVSIPVEGGLLFGKAMQFPNQSDRSKVEIMMQHELGSSIYLDPGFYHHQWKAYFADDGKDLSDHLLFNELTRFFAGPAANGQVRFVKKTGGTTGDYTDPSQPARSILAAVRVCNPYDTVVIMDGESYQEGREIFIDQPIQITSLVRSPAVNGTSAGFPTIDGKSEHRVIRVAVPDSQQTGVVSLTHLEIRRGNVEPGFVGGNGGGSPYLGGGVLIHNTNKTFIGNCIIRQNMIGSGRITAESGSSGLGGGLCASHSSAYISDNFITDNLSGDRGGGAAIFGYGWPVFARNKIHNNRASSFDGRPDGGGVAAEVTYFTTASSVWDTITDPVDTENPTLVRRFWAEESVERAKENNIVFIENEISDNFALDDGGGLYLSVMSNALLKNNIIKNNWSTNDGGGMRATMGSDVLCIGDKIHNNRTNPSQGKDLSSGGGGFSIRNISFELRDVHIHRNQAHGWAGGGVYCRTSAPGNLQINLLAFTIPISFTSILRYVFDVNEYEWNITGSSVIEDNEVSWLSGQENDHRKGAGVYMLRVAESDPTPAMPHGFPMCVHIERMDRIKENRQTNPSNSPQAPAPILDYKEFYLEDMVHRAGQPIHAGNQSRWMSNHTFTYQST